ncbi:hypothetical protein KQI58_12280 [Enterococcus raffinosus]|uniref:DUF7601 domain-containing protein n=1 Tax=Enterococcus raffinosus TaxID=71452 RepID=UPI001C0F4114|nr:FctA domain-containing protein [Enterococcus raffinosus]MBU5361850.1 hypothetical protein [Enterococcus raffinosus]
MKKIVKRLVVGLATISTVVGITIAAATEAKANEENKSDVVDSAVLTKEFQIPNGVTVPEVEFGFTVTPKGVEDDDGVLDESKVGDCVSWTIDETIKFNSSDKVTTGNKLEKSINIWPLIKDLEFSHAGVYYYDVNENITGNSVIIDSKAIYRVRIFVQNTEAGPKVFGLIVEQIQDDTGTETGGKVDPTPKPNHSEFRFINRYWELTKVQVKKIVAGDSGDDIGDRNKDFEFTITLNLPETTKTDFTKVDYKKTDKDGNETTGSVTIDHSNLTGSLEILLKHGETIEFTNLPVGSTYEVVETSVKNYIPSAEVTGLGTSGSSDQWEATEKYTVTVGGITDLFVQAEEKSLDGIKNTTTVTNKYKLPNITGVITDNLPFILMILVAGAGIVFLTVSKRRRAN